MTFTHVKKVFLFLGLLFLSPVLWSQQDTAIVLRSVTIGALPLRLSMAGERVERLDSAQLSAYAPTSVAALLSDQSGLYIKNYGPGTLATSSMRGGSAGQTAIVWNGFQVQSPMLGLLDLSLLPAFLVDEVSVHYGSSGAQWGSGAVGGMIALNNRAPSDSGLKVSGQGAWGSFGMQSYQAKIRYKNNKIATVSRLFSNQATNDFFYKINDQLPSKQQTNAAHQQRGVLQELYWTPTSRQQIAAQVWGQKHQQQIPPLTTQTRSVALQNGDFLRSSLQWRYIGAQQTTQVRGAFFTENIDYQDAAIALRALSNFQTWIAEAENNWHIHPKLALQTGLNHTLYQAVADGYKAGVQETRQAAFANLRWTPGRWKIQLAARQEWVAGHTTPFLPGLGAQYMATNWLTLNARLSRHYRLPTLNDRFWQPGGNPDLLPETGWSEELGYTFIPFKNLTYTATAYHRLIENWILWSQAEGQQFWSSNNITEVRSRGLEQRVSGQFRLQNWHFKAQIGYDYTRSTNEKSLTKPKIEAGAQLWYVPVHQAFGSVSVAWKGMFLQYQHRYTGAVKGISEPLKSFDLGNFRAQYALKRSKANGHLFFQFNNLWNKSYRVVERRPMPGRSFQVGGLINGY